MNFALCLEARSECDADVPKRIANGSPGGWVRKDRSPAGSSGGMVGGKPPSPHISPISTFGLGYPPIPFLRLYKDTKCIVKIINKEVKKIEDSWQRLYSELEMQKN